MELALAFAVYMNALRNDEGLPPLTPNPILMETAQAHAQDMAARRVLTHGSGPLNADTAANRMAARGYRWSFAAENVAFGQRDVAEAFAAWEGSEGHRANMVAPQAAQFGLGLAHNEIGPYWALVLAAPLSSQT